MAKKTPKTPFHAARKYLGLTQTQVSEQTGISQTVISDLESGDNTNPTWEVLGKLCVLYRRRPEELLGWPKLPNQTRSRTRPIAPSVEAFLV